MFSQLVFHFHNSIQITLLNLTEKDGVPGSQVGDVLIDKFGYIWLGTINGLARYDGYEFKRFYNDPNDTTSIKGLIIWSLFEDSKGRIWVGSSPENLNIYDPVTKSFRHYDYKHLIERPANVEIGIAGMCEDDKGRVYLCIRSIRGETISSSLLYFDEKENKIKKFIATDSLAIPNIYRLTSDKKGNIYFLCYTGLFKINTDRKLSKIHSIEIEKELRNNNEYINDLACDMDGHLWLITQRSKLLDFDPQTGKYKTYYQKEFDKSSSGVSSGNKIVFDGKNNLWIGTDKGIYFFDRKRERFENFLSLSVNSI